MLKSLIKSLVSAAGYQIVAKNVITGLGVDPFCDINKILSDSEYNSHLIRQSIDIIFDIGANIGQTSIKLAKKFPNSEIHCFEPVQKTFEELEANVKPYKNIHPYCLGFGKKKEKKEIYIYSKSVLASCIPKSPVISSRKSCAVATLELETIDDYCHKHQISSIDLLKVDTEGFDFEVIQGAQELIENKRINFIYFEFFYVGNDHSTKLGGRLIDVHNFLVPCGYRPVSFYTDFIHNKHIAGCYNALYMRW
ncbi:FkbM family methyltransferase [Oscillatoria acuminata]|uniref:Methyltransferase, FkbM family n=1 Tax=Oscillatoria acuminata PCC 6304 TaxID=56110 RepID=K9TH79_9CYAN|nr:FkbM family methyltransferase [Oscillatoria acuminata]AFY81364.1 methyltransferase, FkbM family [Oscillatoria acuminata PCC 6304]